MRWKQETFKHGDKRINQGFLFFPLNIDKDVRWLVRAVWEEEYWEGWGKNWWAINWVSE